MMMRSRTSSKQIDVLNDLTAAGCRIRCDDLERTFPTFQSHSGTQFLDSSGRLERSNDPL